MHSLSDCCGCGLRTRRVHHGQGYRRRNARSRATEAVKKWPRRHGAPHNGPLHKVDRQRRVGPASKRGAAIRQAPGGLRGWDRATHSFPTMRTFFLRFPAIGVFFDFRTRQRRNVWKKRGEVKTSKTFARGGWDKVDSWTLDIVPTRQRPLGNGHNPPAPRSLDARARL